MITMWQKLIAVSTVGSGDAGTHLTDVYENGGYIDYNYGGEIEIVMAADSMITIDDDLTVKVETEEYTVTVEED